MQILANRVSGYPWNKVSVSGGSSVKCGLPSSGGGNLNSSNTYLTYRKNKNAAKSFQNILLPLNIRTQPAKLDETT